VDDLGEAHTVTADPGQATKFDSDFLEPDEQFAFTFTERGRYPYFCRAHGAPGLQGMAGIVIVE
jgi:plastocyanin